MNSETEVSLPVALLLFCGVVAAYMGLQYKDLIFQYSEWTDVLLSNFSTLIYSFLGILIFNFVILSLYLRRYFALSKQGARLRKIKDRTQDGKSYLISFAVMIPLGFVFADLILSTLSADVPHYIKSYDLYGTCKWLYLVNGSVLFTFLIFRVVDLLGLFKLKSKAKSILPMPKQKNAITLGTVRNKAGNEEWLSVNRKGLNGSVLITGSIGSGKTAGAFMPYFKQSLTNFERVSILALDPKRTFIPKAEKLISEHKPEATVRKISLDGNEAFNPVYLDNALKKSRFVDIAEMVRASAINFSGGKQDSPFWEISSFNLVKNCVVYCAAIKGYFTLKDIYQAMISATTEDLGEELAQVINLAKMKRQQQTMMPQLTMVA